MVSIYNSLYSRETVKYGGEDATVLETDYSSNRAYIEVNGRKFWVSLDSNLFEANAEFERRMVTKPDTSWTDSIKKDMEARDERIKKNNKLWSFCSDKCKQLTKWLNSYLRDRGVKSVKQLQSQEEREEYTAALDEKWDAHKTQLRASNAVWSDSIANFCDACDLMKYT